MGQSKIPLYAYVDESGNTGHNLFDEKQPNFFTAALVTKGDFDRVYSNSVRAIAREVGFDALHGKELGLRRLEQISESLLSLLHRSKAVFFVSRVEKKYLLATKLFDSLFDSGENAAIAWHHYNVRPLRIILAFKMAFIVDTETAKAFWKCILEPNEKKAYQMLPDICARLRANVGMLPDEKSRHVLGEALDWAQSHPESIQIHTDRKSSRQGHFPNMVAFANLLDGLETYSKTFRKKVARITHDQQSEFEKTLAMWHEMYSNASSEEIHWAGETYSLQKVVGSEFDVKEDTDSPGIQVADVVLWLYSKFHKGKSLPPGCSAILDYVFSNGWENDFSFAGVEKTLIERFGPMLSQPLTEEQEANAKEMIAKAEENRQRSMEQYEIDKLPPFMRGSSETITKE